MSAMIIVLGYEVWCPECDWSEQFDEREDARAAAREHDWLEHGE